MMDAVADTRDEELTIPKKPTLEDLLNALGESASTTSKGSLSRIKLKLPDNDFCERSPDLFEIRMATLKQEARLGLNAAMKSDGVRKTDLARGLDCRPQYLQKALDVHEQAPIKLDKILEMFHQLGWDFEITLKPARKS